MIVDMWGKGEIDALIRNNGSFGLDSGHLYTLINPSNLYYGFGHVYNPVGYYNYTGATAASSTPIEEDTLPAGKQNVAIHVVDDGTFSKSSKGNNGGSSNGSIDYNNIGKNSEIASSESASGEQKAFAVIGIITAILGIVSGIASFAKQAGLF